MNKKSEEKFVGQLSINRVSGFQDYVCIRVTDKLSGHDFLELDVDFEEFAKAVTGFSLQKCVFKLRSMNTVGKKREIKHEIVQRPTKYDSQARDDEINGILAPYEIDGWVGSRYDITNHHNWTGDNKVRVCFRRYV